MVRGTAKISASACYTGFGEGFLSARPSHIHSEPRGMADSGKGRNQVPMPWRVSEP